VAPGTGGRGHRIHVVRLLEVVQTDDIIVERCQLNASHEGSETEGRRELNTNTP